MKNVLSISAAMFIALSLVACGSDAQDSDKAQDKAQNSEAGAAADKAQSKMANESPAQQGQSSDSQASTSMNDDSSASGDENAMAMDEDKPEAAIAVLHGTQGNDDAMATIRFTAEGDGLAYTTTASGLAPGKHGYHIHLYGDCSAADGTSAGTHFNLEGSSLNPPADIDHITGDLGDLDVGEDGTANTKGMIAGASLTGPKAVIGRGIIIHAKANDPSQPPIGAAGSRQACGVIGIANPESDGDAASGRSGGSM